MDQAALNLLRVVVALEQNEQVQSLFQLAAECQMEYSWGWRVLAWAEAAGYVLVERNRPPAPLGISSTEHGRSVLAQSESPKWQVSPI